ncbi:MAG: hypothetical protein K1X53_13340 [Candidatus Sumerlaeaceae bacterium]|nr:hypothetical protein [Candidatus Sumerlaeaceae bacterium]
MSGRVKRMKLIGTLLLIMLLALSGPCYAKARFAGKTDMINEAESIVVVNITEVEDSNRKGQAWTYHQKVTAAVEVCLKGDAGSTITLYGLEDFVCARCRYEKGRFILFLRKDGPLWAGCNWHLGVRAIKDGKVQWFKDDKALSDLKETRLDDVIMEIKAVIKEQKIAIPNKPHTSVGK